MNNIIEIWTFADKDFNDWEWNNDGNIAVFYKSKHPNFSNLEIQFFRDILENPKCAILYVSNIGWIKNCALKILKGDIKIVREYD